MKNLTLIIFLFVILSFYACEREVFYEPKLKTIQGQVLSYQTEKPIKNVKFYLIFNQDVIVDSIFSDAEGNFKASFLSFDYWDHQLEVADDPNYFCCNNNSQKIKFYDNRNIYLRPYAFLKVKIKNVKPFDDKDKIEMKTNYFNFNKTFSGNKVDTSLVFKTTYLGTSDFLYSVFRNNLEEKNQIPIKLTPLDTTIVTINY